MKNRYEIKNMTTIIYVRRKGREFKVYIDTEDLSRVSNFNGTWHLDNRGYIKRTLKSKTELMHRIIMEPPEDMVVDHIDGNQLNNKKSNLRIVRRSHNQQNINTSTTRSKSGIKGVRWDGRRGKWTARINVYGKEVFLGYYEEKEDAQIAAISGRIIYHPLSKEKRIYDELMNSKRQFD